jgi:SAM-dependent methyltransferase
MNNDEFIRYLSAKKTVDDRALNDHVWQTFARELKRIGHPRVLELGGGIGTMIERLIERDVLTMASYTLLDEQSSNIGEAKRRLANLPQNIQIDFLAQDARKFLTECDARFDVLIAHAFLDLFDLNVIVPLALDALEPGGIFYFTINFDGETILLPRIDAEFDAQVIATYHKTMDERMIDGRRSGDSRSGRNLFSHLQKANADILACGASDWVVFAGKNGYISGEKYFLRCILDFFESSLSNRRDLEAKKFHAWLAQRKDQLEKNELIFIAHQLDFVGRVEAD